MPSAKISAKQSMVSVRQQIQMALTAILTDIPLIKKRIYLEETYPLQDAQLPCLVISMQEDMNVHEQQTFGTEEKKVWHRLACVIKAYSKNATMSSELATIEAHVITRLALHYTLQGLVKNSEWTQTTLESSYDGEQPIGVAYLHFMIEYRTSSCFPNQTIK